VDELFFTVFCVGKVLNLKNFYAFIVGLIVVISSAGCQLGQQKELLVVDFKADTTLRYKLVSERNTSIDLDPTGVASKGKKSKPQKIFEKLEMVIAYKVVDPNPYGLSTISATCESAKVTRRASKKTPRDAVEYLEGQTFTFKVSPVGKIEDYSEIQKIVSELGEKSISDGGPRKGRIKEMDMIADFITLQWHVWDSIASIENPLDGVGVGDSWSATQIIPLPVAVQAVKDTTYTLKEIDESGEQRLAIIESTFAESKAKYENWPSRYKGRFRMKGTLGFLRGYRITELEGTGRQMFNVDTGTVISEEQSYKVTMSAKFMLPLGGMEPVVVVDQKISLRLMDN
jgi:hypothetical protein